MKCAFLKRGKTSESIRDNNKLICRPTMENVLLKLNVKGGGHNYNVNPEKFACV